MNIYSYIIYKYIEVLESDLRMVHRGISDSWNYSWQCSGGPYGMLAIKCLSSMCSRHVPDPLCHEYTLKKHLESQK